MSGPKGVSYELSEEEKEKRQIIEINSRCDELKKRVSAAYEAIGEKSAAIVVFSRAPKEETIDVLLAWEKTLKAELSKAKKLKTEQYKAHRASQIDKSLKQHTGNVAAIDLGNSDARIGDASKPESRIELSTKKVLDLLAMLQDDEERRTFQARSEGILRDLSLGVSETQLDDELFQLQVDVQKLIRIQKAYMLKLEEDERKMEELEKERDELTLSIIHIDSDVAAALKARIDSAANLRQLKLLKPECVKLIEESRKQEDAKFVALQALEALEELGYVSGKSDVFVQGNKMGFYLYKDSMRHNALKVSIDEAAGSLETALIALDGEGVRTAKQQELAICPDVFTVFESLEERGVKVKMRYHHMPGEVAPPLETGRKNTASEAIQKDALNKVRRKGYGQKSKTTEKGASNEHCY